ncbi:sodium:proton antiporter [Adhaeribacter radiodurans]|uniref:Sodium:proton antiporter n=1 Tax=Adhaeribacter radiodurans TaxID=2745197 RepID=A0A7L7L9K3_9BACT|nr:sodium:proton antiporter [Adhaeribacter radiodurans]QMU29433.1 sodium:proton antiporter [Adhaeribacter radiodurans]
MPDYLLLLTNVFPPVPPFSAIPFLTLLILIACGPVFFEHFWHKYYRFIAVSLGLLVLLYYLLFLHDTHLPAETLADYASFAILLSSLYIAAGGIYINVNARATPFINVLILIIGAILANVIGTTGASLLLIRPYIRLNINQIRTFHIIFFIFIVSNAGGLLTPLGDPPLFIGFLKGVPFFWTLQHLFLPWLLGILGLSAIFFYLDSRDQRLNYKPKEEVLKKIDEKTEFFFTGKRNLIWLAIIIGAIFLDPNVISGLPHIPFHEFKFSFIREIIQLTAAFFCYRYASKTALNGNHFTFAPILEVVFLFFGIFFTMMPALQLAAYVAALPQFAKLLNPNTVYWSAGILSGFLDNAPTYANFLSLSMAKYSLSYSSVTQVHDFAYGLAHAPETYHLLEAIAVASVLFGAFSYIGNGPNFMVKAIAEEAGVKMPSFFKYITSFSIPFLLPVLFLIWLIVIY